MKNTMRYGWMLAAGAALMLGACDTRPKDVKKAAVTEITNAPSPAATGAAPAGAGATATTAAAANLVTYTLGAKTDLRWTGYKVVGQHSGWFTLFDGACKFAGTDPLSGQLECTVETESCETDNETLTPIMKQESFFWCQKYPTMTFKSVGVAQGATGGIYAVTGDLTIRDVTKRITFDAKIWFEDGDKVMRMTSKFYVDRKLWGIIYKWGVGDSVLKDDCLLELDIYGDRQA